MNEINQYIRNHDKPNNLHISLNDVYIDTTEKFIIYGTTLFSQITHNYTTVKHSIANFGRIYIDDNTITIQEMNNIFKKNNRLLNETIDI